MEQWKGIEGFPGYEISSLGRVRHVRYLTPCLDNKGYSIVCLQGDKQQNVKLHRVIAEAFIPNPENKSTVDHINRDPSDNRLENLRWANMSEQNSNRKNPRGDMGHIYPTPEGKFRVRFRKNNKHPVEINEVFVMLSDAVKCRDDYLQDKRLPS